MSEIFMFINMLGIIAFSAKDILRTMCCAVNDWDASLVSLLGMNFAADGGAVCAGYHEDDVCLVRRTDAKEEMFNGMRYNTASKMWDT